MNQADAYYKILVNLGIKQRIQKPLWNTTLFGVKLELKALGRYLSKGERIYCLVPCRYKRRKALAVVTDVRVLVLNRGLLGDIGLTQREEVYFNQIAGGNPEGGLFSSYTLAVPGSGNDFRIDDLWYRDARVFDKSFNQARQDYERKKLTPETEPVGKSSSVSEKVRAVTELFRQDQVTKDEYLDLVEEILRIG